MTTTRARAFGAQLLRVLLTLAVVALAIWAALRLWDHYELAPWTRDGRVRANVVQVAPDVSGLVSTVRVQDNQPVHAGDVLFEIDPARFALAVQQARAGEQSVQVGLAQARREDARNASLSDLVPREAREQTRARMEAAAAAMARAEVDLHTAELNLARATVRAPVDGWVTNLDLRTGAYAAAGRGAMAIVDRGSFYVEGYFEETKLARIHPGDAVRVTPMGSRQALSGTVQSIAAGIADRDRSTGANLLPSVNPTFNWVRLAQRVPVRVQLDTPPSAQGLVAGQTVLVEVVAQRDAPAAQGTGAGNPKPSEAPPAAKGASATAAEPLAGGHAGPASAKGGAGSMQGGRA
ncbi:efflux RND transporter periplasmic adaptor subunit [uncultured Pseudacidovorax sp.]|uniref:efflux RND transporter periplasmic adaptor subunit n=1 Tax=uncultured Pseudacidovorax sp. TaxID=679313 RepID=UPI0025CFABA6|nr:efflux RND transporter periplasmic adaptor subunit [uncultured Pseudacidovorax sp.]